MKNHNEKKTVSLSAKILAGALAAFLLFGSCAVALMYLFA